MTKQQTLTDFKKWIRKTDGEEEISDLEIEQAWHGENILYRQFDKQWNRKFIETVCMNCRKLLNHAFVHNDRQGNHVVCQNCGTSFNVII